jgi:hypothetical protein
MPLRGRQVRPYRGGIYCAGRGKFSARPLPVLELQQRKKRLTLSKMSVIMPNCWYLSSSDAQRIFVD